MRGYRRRNLQTQGEPGQGDADLACAEGQTGDCFAAPARFMRVEMIAMARVALGEAVHKVAHVDLLDIADPNGVARQGVREDGVFIFPFVAIEDADPVDDTHIMVGNDNDVPFSSGRALDRPTTTR